MSAKEYWNNLYADRTEDCKARIKMVAEDMFREIDKRPRISGLLWGSVMELGCGTGELGDNLMTNWTGMDYLGVDHSQVAIDIASKNYPYLKFICEDVYTMDSQFDIVITTNTLEHFKDPYKMIDKLLSMCKYLFILVPYKQEDYDGYDEEGGAGHVFSFSEDSFQNYNVYDWFTFFSHSWVQPPNPLVMLIILENGNIRAGKES